VSRVVAARVKCCLRACVRGGVRVRWVVRMRVCLRERGPRPSGVGASPRLASARACVYAGCMTTQTDTIRLGIDHPDWRARDSEPQPATAAAPALELFVVVARNAGVMDDYPAEFFDVWADGVESAHWTVTQVLRNRRDDHATDIVGVWVINQRTFL